jgi:deoxyribodipyrimidine photolyase-related protein
MRFAVVVFPHQLFDPHPALKGDRHIYVVEAPRFFRDEKEHLCFHQQKLALHRGSLKAYEARLANQGYTVSYLEFEGDPHLGGFWGRLKKDGVATLYAADPVDHLLEERLKQGAKAAGVKLHFTESPGFLCSQEEIRAHFEGVEHFHHTSFYIHQRKTRGILLDKDKPAGGHWTYDTENRRRLPKEVKVPPPPQVAENEFHREARDYVAAKFSDHPGSLEFCRYPVTHEEAQDWLRDFLENRLKLFGDYQDSISARESVLFHSLLSPLINIGLLTPGQVLEETLAYAQKHRVPLNSLEGFLRQVLGWREYVRAVYLLAGERQRTANFFGHTRQLPPGFYDGTTGVLPLDIVIQRLLETAYAHHIERLMVLGNFLFLCEVDPREVYRWFMDLFIDAYDWVMVPNVFGMSQFADGGLMMTKPYFSSSNYLRKMSDFPKGDWEGLWDALYWRFVKKNRDYLAKNPRLIPMMGYLDRMAPAKHQTLLKTAEDFLKTW